MVVGTYRILGSGGKSNGSTGSPLFHNLNLL